MTLHTIYYLIFKCSIEYLNQQNKPYKSTAELLVSSKTPKLQWLFMYVHH